MSNFFTRIFAFLFFNSYEKRVAAHLKYPGLLVLNFFVQRIFGVNKNIKYSVHFTSKVNGTMERLIIENNSLSVLTSLAVSGGCYISMFRETVLTIGEGTIWAPGISIVTNNHGLLNREEYTKKSIIIGKNCWLAKGACVMPGVILGDNITVGANAVVTKSFSPNVVIAGTPARIIKNISDPDNE